MLPRSEIGSKNVWQIMGRIMGKQTSTATITPLCKTDNTYAFEQELLKKRGEADELRRQLAEQHKANAKLRGMPNDENIVNI